MTDRDDPLYWLAHDTRVAREKLDDADVRAAMVRALVAQQWATAISLVDNVDCTRAGADRAPGHITRAALNEALRVVARFADLPCAEDFITCILGEP